MKFSKQQHDVRRIDELAILCRGKTAVAAVLAVRPEGITTVDHAARLVNESPDQVRKLLARPDVLYYRWIADAMDDIRANLSKIDFTLVSTVRGADLPTNPIFEQVFIAIEEKIDRDYGVLSSLNEISKSELSHATPRASIIRLATEIKSAALEMKGLCWRLLHPWVYIVTSIKLILGLLVLGVSAVLILYFLSDHPTALHEKSSTFANADFVELVKIFDQQNRSFWRRALDSIQYIFHTALLLPSLFAVVAALLALARQALPAGGTSRSRLRGFEEALYDLGRTLQQRLPQPPKGPTFVIGRNQVGDSYTSIGGKAAMGPNATFNDYAAAWKQQGQDTDLKVLGDQLELLRLSLKEKTQDTPEEDDAISIVGQAAKAAKAGDGPTVLKRLAKAGGWALKVAEEIGAKVAVEMITASMKVK